MLKIKNKETDHLNVNFNNSTLTKTNYIEN